MAARRVWSLLAPSLFFPPSVFAKVENVPEAFSFFPREFSLPENETFSTAVHKPNRSLSPLPLHL